MKIFNTEQENQYLNGIMQLSKQAIAIFNLKTHDLIYANDEATRVINNVD